MASVSISLNNSDGINPSSKLKGFADDVFESDENGRKFSKRVENNVGNGEIARNEQFLLFPQRFQKNRTADMIKNQGQGRKLFEYYTATVHQSAALKPFPNKPCFLRVCSINLSKTMWEKEKLLVTSNFSFSQCFLSLLEKFLPCSFNLKLSSANSSSLDESKIGCLGEG